MNKENNKKIDEGKVNEKNESWMNEGENGWIIEWSK